MNHFRWTAAFLLSLSAIALARGDARAEAFLDARLGGAFTDDSRLEIVVSGVPASASIAFDDSFTAGLRGGYWLAPLPWFGIAFDVSYFSPDENALLAPLRIDVVPVSALFMVRVPLGKSRALPHGRIQPYAGVGPALFVTFAEENTTNFVAGSVDLGLDVRGGLNVQILSWLDVFAEYRFTHYEAGLDDDLFSVPVTFRTEIDTHHITGGVGFHF